MKTTPDHYAVIGHPVEHSRSPDIHGLFAEQCGEPIRYTHLPAPRDGFKPVAETFFRQGGAGLNVTLPFKQEAADLADQLSERATRAGAVNTLMVTERGLLGDNTDGAGLLADLEGNLQFDLVGRQILILGAGGAVRGVVPALLERVPARIIIANRSADKAQSIARACQDSGTVTACGLEDIPGGADLVINAISAGLSGHMPELDGTLLVQATLAYDMLYGDAPTPFMNWAARHHVPTISDGFGMLVEQAAESFFLWRGTRPETRDVIAALRPPRG